MKVFISWSGDQSKAVAFELQQWLQEVIQAVEPWMSTDIAKGRKWLDQLNSQLATSKIAVLCLTRSALLSPWMHYEAGAIAKTKDALVCNLLLGIEAEDVTYPLAQFQATRATKEDVRDLLGSINEAVGRDGGRPLSEKILDRVFERSWDRFAESLESALLAPDSSEFAVRPMDEPALEELDMMDEMIGVTLLSRHRAAWSVQELVPAVFRSLSPKSQIPPPAMLAMMARQFEKKNLPRLIQHGFAEVANDRYALTEVGQTHFDAIADRVREFQLQVSGAAVNRHETQQSQYSGHRISASHLVGPADQETAHTRADMIPQGEFHVYISSVSEDLSDYRTAAFSVTMEMGWTPRMMENNFYVKTTAHVAAVREVLMECKLMILIIAFQRGWVPALEQGGNGVDSITALEFACAKEHDISVLVFLSSVTGPRELWERPRGRWF